MASSTKRRPGKGKKNKDKEKNGRKRDRKLNAKTADRYDLYQRAVNSPETDVDFLIKAYEQARGKKPHHLREDFCGTAALAAEWLSRDAGNSAEGFDLDPEPIEWGKRNNFTKLEDGEARMTFHLKDVRNPAEKRPDVTTAANFSYWCFHERKELLGYFQSVRADLADDGILVVDLFGGPEALTEMEEVRRIGGGIEYVWDQKTWWPGSGEYESAIHFRFKDGSEMRSAFEYSWRFWHLTEIKDVLLDAGFVSAEPYFEGTDEDDEEAGDGIFEHDPRGENCEAWIGYLVAKK
ncbi:MAG: class I SAM-dependent methyltransferase [bacterium]|nr:class I SAM-dependent methyltransferase [bacterium]